MQCSRCVAVCRHGEVVGESEVSLHRRLAAAKAGQGGAKLQRFSQRLPPRIEFAGQREKAVIRRSGLAMDRRHRPRRSLDSCINAMMRLGPAPV